MAATADVVAPALEGPSLEVLDPQLPQETEHENVPVPIEVTRACMHPLLPSFSTPLLLHLFSLHDTIV